MRKGFTLAELLIIMCMLGVIAAMLMPTMICKMNGTCSQQSNPITEEISTQDYTEVRTGQNDLRTEVIETEEGTYRVLYHNGSMTAIKID